MALLNVLRAAAILAMALSLAIPLPAARAAAPEHEVKAVFLFNFTLFVDWPAHAFEQGDSPLVIAVLGSDPFGAVLDEVVRGEVVNGRPLAVRRYRSVEEIHAEPHPGHILFIARSERSSLGEILEALQGRSILTVSDIEDFAAQGGMIRFATVQNKIRLQINLDAARAADLTISSKLLRPAEIVASGEAGRR